MTKQTFQFVSTHQETQEGTETPATETPATETPATETPATETPATEKPATEKPAVETPAAPFQDSEATQTPAVETKKPDPPQDVDAPPETAEEEAGAIGGLEMEDAPEEEAERKVKPLKDCADDIKRSLAMAPARKAMEDAIAHAEVQVGLHFDLVLQSEDEYGESKDTVPPFDYQSTSKEYGLDSGETGLVDDLELEDQVIGKVRVFMNTMSQGRQMPQLVPVSQLVFNTFEDVRLYDTQTVNDWTSQSIYLFWLSEKAETRIPSFEESKPQIEKFWRQNKARALALADAEKIKGEMDQALGKKLSEVKEGERVFQTGGFTWFSSIGRTIYSNPINVENAGEDFMEAAFSLEKLQSGIATNMSKDVVYVIQSLTGPREVEETGMDYLENQLFKYKRIPTEVLRASRVYGQDLNLGWNQELQKAMDFKYIDR